jgi:uncharacterized protein
MRSETNPLAKHGRLSYLEIPAMDPRQSAAFYERVFGWKIDRRSSDDFRFSDREGLLIGRWATGRVASREAGVLPFIYVEDIEAAIARVSSSGGEIVKAPYAEGDVRVARIRDPAGNLVGLWQFS